MASLTQTSSTRWWALLALLAWVWVGVEAVTHHHDDADEGDCSVCAVAAQSAEPMAAVTTTAYSTANCWATATCADLRSDLRPEETHARGPPAHS